MTSGDDGGRANIPAPNAPRRQENVNGLLRRIAWLVMAVGLVCFAGAGAVSPANATPAKHTNPAAITNHAIRLRNLFTFSRLLVVCGGEAEGPSPVVAASRGCLPT